ncbi:Helix-turn-helix domain-containing protein [Singulisphaera sp. GP187]|uniref:DNA N-6-adenine-methyltransferase n=1 Tax=Singulisphaera sp. GP187 TaxID=1882752 RepID=UPI000926FD35|nr:DNA N-6-adenine-methyltransferase [Singulisphaera sp. GP187]SIO63205.1 Helix-turn-helix domain-containing protein [Singulisphaera sp. GP187]
MLKLPWHSGLGPDLRDHRKASRTTQAELARLTGLSLPTIRPLEAGRGNLDSWRTALEPLGLELAGRNLPAGDSLGVRVATLRRRRGLSQRGLAALVEVSHPTVVALERRGEGRLSTLERVLTVLGAGTYLARRGQARAFFTHAGNSSTDDTWETPAPLLEALHSIFGRFDLDPCASRRSRTRVKARVHLTAEGYGLSVTWHGIVFVNPPYGRALAAWVAKARREVEEGLSCTGPGPVRGYGSVSAIRL